MQGLSNRQRKPEVKAVVGQWDHCANLSWPGWLWPDGLGDGDAWPFSPPLPADRGMTDLRCISLRLERSQRRQGASHRGRIRA